MKISIAMTTFNGAKYLQEQLHSFAMQTRKPDELIICDDGSTDETPDVVECFSATSSFPVTFIRNESNLGFARNFEKAISLCSGDIIALSDQDDVWLENKLEIVEQTLEQAPQALASINDLIICNGDMSQTPHTKLSQLKSLGLPEAYFITGCCTTIRRELLEIALPFPEGVEAHDVWLNKIADMLGQRIVIRQPLQLYRRHDSNTSDDITSSKKKATQLDLIKRYGMRDARADWQKEILNKQCYITRLTDAEEIIGRLELTQNARPAVTALQSEAMALSKRIAITSIPRWRRWTIIAQHLIRGSYPSLSGYKSAIKDLLRP